MEDGCPSADRCDPAPAPAPIYLLVQLVDPSVPLSLSCTLFIRRLSLADCSAERRPTDRDIVFFAYQRLSDESWQENGLMNASCGLMNTRPRHHHTSQEDKLKLDHVSVRIPGSQGHGSKTEGGLR